MREQKIYNEEERLKIFYIRLLGTWVRPDGFLAWLKHLFMDNQRYKRIKEEYLDEMRWLE
ncbi:MAG TPA: hypothetical protein ENI27_08540 [bacterium]|nr:hypothetical protein [bacterium]